MTEYSAESIKILKDAAHVRERPGMYIQNTGSAGLHQLVKEVLDNSIDEYMAGHVTEIMVTHYGDGSVSVQDNGRGIPTEKHPKTKKSTLETIFTILGAGGKFDRNSYSVSAGLHGVGVTVVNALSEWTNVRTVRKRTEWKQNFSRGKATSRVSKVEGGGRLLKKGTLVHFLPDYDGKGPFNGFNATIHHAVLRDWLSALKYLCPGLRLCLIDDERGTRENFKSSEGLTEFVSQIARDLGATALHSKPLFVQTPSMDVAILWTDDDNEVTHSYVNSSPTPEGGTHLEGLQKTVSRLLRQLHTSNDKIAMSDLRAGMVAAIHLRHIDPHFKGQTKDQLTNTDVEAAVSQELTQPIIDFLQANLDLANTLVARAVALNKARDKFKAEQSTIRKLVVHKVNKRGVLPGKLAEAPKCKPHERELFICEGDSAGGSIKFARDAYYQEVLGLKGKIPNASRVSAAKFLMNREIQDIITCIGTKTGDLCEPDKCRVGKVLLLPDSDPDGQHIAALCLAFFTLYMPQLVDSGMLYVVDAPLFVTSFKGLRYYGHSLQEVRSALPKNGKQSPIVRLKGHGEANAAEVREYAMNPETRKLIKITSGEDAEAHIERLMGSDGSARKLLLGIA
jgi:DNA gyrase subunit B